MKKLFFSLVSSLPLRVLGQTVSRERCRTEDELRAEVNRAFTRLRPCHGVASSSSSSRIVLYPYERAVSQSCLGVVTEGSEEVCAECRAVDARGPECLGCTGQLDAMARMLDEMRRHLAKSHAGEETKSPDLLTQPRIEGTTTTAVLPSPPPPPSEGDEFEPEDVLDTDDEVMMDFEVKEEVVVKKEAALKELDPEWEDQEGWEEFPVESDGPDDDEAPKKPAADRARCLKDFPVLMPELSEDGRAICKICDRTFPTRRQWNSHMHHKVGREQKKRRALVIIAF